ncbi:hypothetical protein, partial [Ligilactobacillus salivarius]|uniref:hypothetical protein n=2 Tax=Ligilactobacillus salivarius TaxID=1624 RepID=UPI001CDB6D2F
IELKEHGRMNENIKNMVEELKHEFPDLKEDIDLIIYDEKMNGYFLDDEFKEQMLYKFWINYKGISVGIIKANLEDNLFYIESCSYMNQEDLIFFSKIITIIFKHLSKIEFK